MGVGGGRRCFELGAGLRLLSLPSISGARACHPGGCWRLHARCPPSGKTTAQGVDVPSFHGGDPPDAVRLAGACVGRVAACIGQKSHQLCRSVVMHGSKCRIMACFHGSDGAMHGRSLPYGVPRHPGGSGEPSGSRWRGCSATCRGHKGGGVTERRPKNAFFRPAVNLSRFVRCPQTTFWSYPGTNCL